MKKEQEEEKDDKKDEEKVQKKENEIKMLGDTELTLGSHALNDIVEVMRENYRDFANKGSKRDF